MLSPTELEGEYFYIRYASRGTVGEYRDGVSRYQVEFDGHVRPVDVERRLPKKLFDVPREVAGSVYVASFHEVNGEIDALPANGRTYRVNGRVAYYWNPLDWGVKSGDVVFYRDGKAFYVAREFDGLVVVLRNPSRREVEAMKRMERPEVPGVPADWAVYDLRSGVVHYFGVDCGAFRCNFRWWNGLFMVSGLPLVDGLYDVVVGDWREFLKDDPGRIDGEVRPLGVWVPRDRVCYVRDGYVSYCR